MHEVLLCPSWCEKKKGRRFGRRKHTKPTDKYLQGERRSLEDEEEEKTHTVRLWKTGITRNKLR